MSNSVGFQGNKFVTELSISEIEMLVEALDYAVLESRRLDEFIFRSHETPQDGADVAESLSKQLRMAINGADKGYIIIER